MAQPATGTELIELAHAAMLENTTTQLAFFDLQFNFVCVNAAYASGSGHAVGQLIGRNHFDLFPSAQNRAIFEHVRDTGVAVAYRARPIEFADQPERGVTYWDWILSPVKGASCSVEGLVLSLVDVTQQVRADQALRQSEQRYRSLFAGMLEGCALHEIICDQNGKPIDYRFLDANPAFAELTGLDPRSIIGRTVRELLPGTEDHWIATYGEVALTGKPVRFENYAEAIGKWFQVAAYSPAPGQFAAVFTDVSGHRRLEAELARARDELEARARERTAELAAVSGNLALHARRLEILRRIEEAALGLASVTEVAEAAAAFIRQAIPCEQVTLSAFDLERWEGRFLAVEAAKRPVWQVDDRVSLDMFRLLPAYRRGEIGVIDDLGAFDDRSVLEQAMLEAGITSHMGIPLMADGQLIGAINLASREACAFSPEQIETARQVADALAVALQAAKLHELLAASRAEHQELSRHLVRVQEAERLAVARELHDESGQALTALLVNIANLQRGLHGSADLRASLEGLKEQVAGIMEGLHRISAHLRPASLDRHGLVPSLRQYLKDYGATEGIATEFEAAGLGEERLPAEVEIALFRVVQEALTNVSRHAQASRVGVLLQGGKDQVTVIVEDDGIGFDTEQAEQRGRLGLLGMRERMEMIDGVLTVESTPGQGTTIFARIPLPAQSAHQAGAAVTESAAQGLRGQTSSPDAGRR